MELLSVVEFENLGGIRALYSNYKKDAEEGIIDSIPLFGKAMFRVNIIGLTYKGTDVIFGVGKYESIYWSGDTGLFYREKQLKIGDSIKLQKYVAKKYGKDVISRFLLKDVEYFPSQKRIGEVPERHKNRKELNESEYLRRLLFGTPLKYFPPKEVVNALYLGYMTPFEYIGHMEYINNLIAYLIVHNIEPLKQEYKNKSALKFVYDMKLSYLKMLIKRNWGA